MEKRNARGLISGWVLLVLVSCSKYKEVPSISNPAYLRVFNSLNYTYTPTTENLPPPFMVFLFDPVFDKSGLANNAAIVGDFIDTRDLFSTSYPAQAGNIAVLRNKDWPGSKNVLTAPTINGLDLSAWAQIPSGRHRILLVGRPQSDTAFVNLPASARSSIIADTTVDFSPGEVYTLEAVTYDDTHQKTGAYVRKENFTKINFSYQENYFNFYNLSAANPNPSAVSYPYSVYPFTGPLNLYYSTFHSVCVNDSTNGTIGYSCSVTPDPAYQFVYFNTVGKNFETAVPFDSLPLPSLANFLNPDGSFRSPAATPFTYFEIHQLGSSPAQPTRYTSLTCTAQYPNFDGNFSGIGNVDGSPPLVVYLCPSLTITTSNGQQIQPYPSINTFELINNRIYMMQLHRTFYPPQVTP